MKENAEKLIKKYVENTASPEERAIVEAGLLRDFKAGYAEISDEEIKASCQRISTSVETYLAQKSQRQKSARVRRIYLGVATIAAAVSIIVFSWWSYTARQKQRPQNPVATILPENITNAGESGATITLADGSTIALSDQQSGVVIGDHSLMYEDGTAVETGTSIENRKLSAATAKGQTYNFVLPDGTKVWLNAASEITISQPFGGSKREIDLKGEAYFEVAKHKKAPFTVRSENQTIEVLGTHFNVRAYPDLQSRTTLLEGRIQIAPTAKKYTVLYPGQEASVSNQQISVKETDADAAVSWVSGLFNFDGRSFKEIMQEVSDWYDLEVVYEGKIPKGTFFGQAYKSDNLATVLRLLESAQLQYRITQDRKLVILNKAL